MPNSPERSRRGTTGRCRPVLIPSQLPDNGGSVALASGEEQPRTGAHARMAKVRERAQVDRRRADECEAESLEKGARAARGPPGRGPREAAEVDGIGTPSCMARKGAVVGGLLKRSRRLPYGR